MKRKPSWDFSVPGLIYSSMMMFMGIAAMNTQANLLFGVFGLMIGVLLVSGVISRLVLVGLTVRRGLPDAAVVGQPTSVGYEFVNVKRFWPSLSVQVAELDGVEAFRRQPHAYLLHAHAGGTARVQVEVIPKRRGVHKLDHYQIATSFPFGFVKRAIIKGQEDSLLVFPALARVDARVLRLLRSADLAGITVRPQRGGEDEIYGVKEYRPGENPRMIHWRRSARTATLTGQLTAREMTRVSPPRVMVLVDTRLTDRSAESHAAVERAIAVAASLASQALEQGLMVGVAAAGGGTELVMVHPSRGKRHRRDVLSALATLPVNTTFESRRLVEEGMKGVRAGTTVVMVTPYEREMSLAELARGGGAGGVGGGGGGAGGGAGGGGGGGVITLAAGSTAVRGWFEFPPGVDFSMTMPADQQPELPARGKG